MCGGKEKKDDSHLRSVNWWRRHDFPTPMSPMMMYLKMNSYGNDIAAVAVVAGLSLLREKNEAKKKRVKKKAITHSKKGEQQRKSGIEKKLQHNRACAHITCGDNQAKKSRSAGRKCLFGYSRKEQGRKGGKDKPTNLVKKTRGVGQFVRNSSLYMAQIFQNVWIMTSA